MTRAVTPGIINWEEVHERLRRSEEFFGNAFGATPQRIEAVFRRRALELAREDTALRPVTAGFPALGFPALICTAAGENYVIALDQIAEIAAFRGCTPVPGARRGVVGVLTWRGGICPVIDLGLVLTGTPSAGAGAALILRGGGVPPVLKVDAAPGMREIRAAELGQPLGHSFLKPLASGGAAFLDPQAMLAALFSTTFPGKESRLQ